MFKLAVIALLGMVVVAAAVDAEVQKQKHYKEKEEEYEKDTKVVYKPYYPSKANVWAKHMEWDLTEIEGTDKTHPCDQQYEILGSTVSYFVDLADDKNKNVGSVSWSGIVTHHDTCGHCKDYKAKTEHIVKVNYQVTFEFTEEHKGQITCGGVSTSIFSEDSFACAVLGGTGAFEGVWGTITWTSGKPPKYAFDIYFPKIVEVKEYKEKDHKDEKYDEKY
jgi:hypothetical protein